jgi:Tfp pilus assembly protein PilF
MRPLGPRPQIPSQPARRSLALRLAIIFFLVSPAALRVSAQLPGHVSAPQDALSDANITVHVFGPDHAPLKQMAFVTLFQKGSTMALGTVMTSVSSEAVLTGMPGYGPYTVTVSSKGYQTETKDFEFNAASGRVYVDVTLQPLANSHAVPNPEPPLSPQAQEHVQKGLEAMQARKFQEAQAEFQAAYKQAPQNSDVCYYLGAAYQKTNDLSQAAKYLNLATSLDPDNVQALVAIGQLRDQQKDYQAAIAPLEKAATLDGKQWLARWVLADAYLRTGKYDLSLRYSQAAIALGNGSANKAELIEGEALLGLGRRDDAIKAFESFLNDLPNDPSAPAVRNLLAKLQSAAPASSPH